MNMLQLRWVNFLLLVSGITLTFGQFTQQDIELYPLRIYGCDGSDNLLDIYVNLRNKNDQGEKVLDVKLDLEDEFTNNWQLLFKVDHWNNGDWDQKFYETAGLACELVQKYVPKIWKNLRQSFSPAMPGDCDIEPGHYELTNFEISADDYELPATMLGTFRFIATVSDESGTEVWCQIMEIEVDKK